MGYDVEQRPAQTGFAPGKWAVRMRDGRGFLAYFDTEVVAREAAAEFVVRAARLVTAGAKGETDPRPVS